MYVTDEAGDILRISSINKSHEKAKTHNVLIRLSTFFYFLVCDSWLQLQWSVFSYKEGHKLIIIRSLQLLVQSTERSFKNAAHWGEVEHVPGAEPWFTFFQQYLMSVNLSEPPGVGFPCSPRPRLLFSLAKYLPTFFYLLKPANALKLASWNHLVLNLQEGELQLLEDLNATLDRSKMQGVIWGSHRAKAKWVAAS